MDIWINPACSKCRAALAQLDAAGVNYSVRHYLQSPPTTDELTAVLERLGMEPWELVRMKDTAATETGLNVLPQEAELRPQWIATMSAHPSLIQRPIATAADGTTVVGRTPEAMERVIAASRIA